MIENRELFCYTPCICIQQHRSAWRLRIIARWLNRWKQRTWLSFCGWYSGSVFSCVPNIRLRRRDDLVQSSEIMAHYDRSRSSNGTNRQPVCDFLSAVDSIVGYRPIFHRFRDAATKTPRNIAVFTRSCSFIWAPTRTNLSVGLMPRVKFGNGKLELVPGLPATAISDGKIVCSYSHVSKW